MKNKIKINNMALCGATTAISFILLFITMMKLVIAVEQGWLAECLMGMFFYITSTAAGALYILSYIRDEKYRMFSYYCLMSVGAFKILETVFGGFKLSMILGLLSGAALIAIGIMIYKTIEIYTKNFYIAAAVCAVIAVACSYKNGLAVIPVMVACMIGNYYHSRIEKYEDTTEVLYKLRYEHEIGKISDEDYTRYKRELLREL